MDIVRASLLVAVVLFASRYLLAHERGLACVSETGNDDIHRSVDGKKKKIINT